MKMNYKLLSLSLGLAFSSLVFSCSERTQSNASATVNSAGNDVKDATRSASNEVGEEFNQFSSWVKDKSAKAATVTKEEWDQMKTEYKEQEAKIEANSSTWDNKTKKAWKKMKAEWNETENKVQARFKD
jgi:hypothetical protein